MAFTFSTALGNYNDRRYEVIRNLEESKGVPKLTAYKDSKGYATIGAGFKVDSWAKEILKSMNLSGVGKDDQTAIFKKVAAAITNATKGTFATDDAAQTAIDNALNTVLWLRGSERISFAYSNNDQVKATFGDIADSFEKQVNTWFGAANGAIPESRERLALLSLAYNNVLSNSPSLRQALIEGDRAKAWFEIRYRSNGDKSDGIAKRRYYESALFGLFADPSAVTIDEALNAFRMLTGNRQSIIDYEKKYGEWQDASGTYTGTKHNNVTTAASDYAAVLSDLPLGKVPTAVQAFDSAKFVLLAKLRADNPSLADLDITSYLSTSIYLDPGRNSAKEAITDDHKATLDARLWQDNGPNSGTEQVASNDILIGEGGDDVLIGGKGNDILIGGEGYDTYIWEEGDGNDRIVDSDMKGRIVIKGVNYELIPSAFLPVEGQASTWKSPDGKLTLTHNSPWKLVLPDGSELQIGDFNDGDLGIHLGEAEQTPEPTLTITGDITPVDTKPDPGIQADGDAQGNPYGTGGAPYEDILGGSAGNDHILAGELNDDVAGEAGDDWIEGGSGNDYLGGRSGDDLIEGGAGSDILIGEEGNDRLYANSKVDTATAIENGNNDMGSGQKGDWLAGNDGDDLLVGGADNDVLSGGLGADLLIGGAGDDNLLGDSDYTAAYQWEDSSRYSIGSTDWYHSNATTYDWTVTPGPDNTVFAPVTGEANPAGGGADVIYAGAGKDSVWAGEGDDTVLGEGDDDKLAGEAGNDVLLGGSGADWLYGDATYLDGSQHGDDFLDGGEGDDILYGEGGSDALFGGAGNDEMVGDDNDNTIDQQGDDTLDGEDGDDKLYGMGGADTLYGGAGDDLLVGDNGDTPEDAMGEDEWHLL